MVLDKKIFKICSKISLFPPLRPLCAMDRNHLYNFERGSPKEQSGEVSSNLGQWFLRRCRLKKKFTDDGRRTTDDGRQAMT